MAWKLKVNGQETTTINAYTVKNIVNKGKTYNFDRPEQTGTTMFEFSSLSAESYLGIYKTTNTPIEIYVGDALNTTITDIGMYEVNLTSGTSISSTVTVKIIGGEFCCGGVDSPGPGLFYRKNGISTNSIFSISKIVLGSNYVDVMPTHMFKTLNVNSENMEISIPDGVSLIYVNTYTIGGAISQYGLKSQYFKSISIDENNPIYDSRDNCNAIIETATNKLISGCNMPTFTVPNTVTSIANGAFYYCDQLTNITLPEGLESIERVAFAYCPFTKLTIPSTIKNIEPGAFKACKSLTKLTVASNNPFYDSRDNCNAIIETATNNLITGCNTSTFTIPNTVTSIEDYAFYECDQLTDIILSDKIKSIGNSAFYYCDQLTNITLPEGLESIGNSTFSNCALKGTLNIPSTVKSIGKRAFYSCASLTNVPMPEGLQSIGEEAFYSAFNISSIHIPSTVTNIGYRAFRDCRFLDKLTVDSNNPIYDSRDNCNAIIETATNTLLFGTNETIIPNTVTTIGEYAFDTRLDFQDVDLNIPEGVQIIESYAFFDCDFTSVTIHSTVKNIKHNAFESCTILETVTLSEGLENIEDKAFLAANALKKITIPSTVTYIGALVWCNALTNALNLTEITFNHSETDSLTLHPEVFGPITTSSVKSAKALTVYHYGNPTVLNHNYAGANITPTFVDLREQQ